MELERQSLLIRADANAQMGTGHLMRCLALAQAWQAQDGQAVFITACDSARLLKRLQDEGFQFIHLEETYPNPGEWATTSQVLAAHRGAWVVLDGYHFDPAYQRRIKETGHALLVVDDMAHMDHYHADVILNQNIHADQLVYSCEPDTHLLMGTRYALLRREFWPWRGWEREILEVARRVLVTLGGADPDNQTLKVIQALQRVRVDGLEATVVVGASSPHFQELEAAVHHLPFTTRLIRNASNMPELMTWADIAVSAGGSTCWEIVFLGLPSVLLTLANNQQRIAEGLDKVGVSLNLGWYEEVTENQTAEALSHLVNHHQQRRQMSCNGQTLVDGMGGERVVEVLSESQ
jgi:UDP-2,4-diacetamido-2,4,6-trideoxy-beta-L-altropyranose hydrolase